MPPLSTSSIMYVYATDKDSGLNGEIDYSIITKTPMAMFTIHTRDGAITAKQKLGRGEKYTLVVQAKDKGSPIRATNVTCYISVGHGDGVGDGVGDGDGQRMFRPPAIRFVITTFPPISRVTNIALPEDADLKSVVAKAVLHKKGKRFEKRFEIVGGNVGGAFRIGRKDGNVRLARSLDYERVKSYKLVVRAVFKNGESAVEVKFWCLNIRNS